MSNVSDVKDRNRRGFLRKLFGLTAAAGVTGLLLDRSVGKTLLPPVQASTSMVIDTPNTGAATTSLSSPGNPALTATNTSNGAGLQGTSTAGTGVLGTTTTGTGVQGTASSTAGVALAGFASNPGAIPIVAQGSSGQSANLQEWRGSSGALGVVDANGNFGVGTAAAQSHLYVVDSTTSPSRGVIAAQHNDGRQAALAQMKRSRGSEGAPTALQNGDYVGAFNFNAYSGSSYLITAGFGAYTNGTVGTSSVPTDLFFYTRATGTTDPYGDGSVRMVVSNNGNVYLSGTLFQNSDMRLKTDIQPIDNALEKVLRLNGVYFQWRRSAKQADGRQVGVIAQNIQRVLPEIVSTSAMAKDYLSVDYTKLVPVLIEATKEQQSTIQRLQEESEKLHERIAILERTVKQLAAS